MKVNRIKVWDLVVRGTHGLFAALVLGAFLTADDDENTLVHTRLGLVVLGLVLLRVGWGFVGSHYARFAEFVRSPRVVLAELKQMTRGTPGEYIGHNPVGAVMVIALLAALLVVTATGVLVALGPEWSGPLAMSKSLAGAVKELHEASAWTLAVMVGLHVCGVVLSSVLERQNLVTGMITGFKRAQAATVVDEPTPIARAAGFALSALLAATLVVVLWRLLPIGTAEAATPLQARYELQAKQEDPTFTRFDPARGKAFYFAVHPAKSGELSCATCHTEDPTKAGRSPAGKNIEPLAPSATPERFTDGPKSDKWFDRNCKQVLSRVCTYRERGDLLAWLLTL
jgi:cytochrome b